MKYQLIHVNPNGYYAVLSGVPATDDVESLRMLDESYKKLRPGWGRLYKTVLCEIHESGRLTDESLKRVWEARESLP
jgi:hypothetical protein